MSRKQEKERQSLIAKQQLSAAWTDYLIEHDLLDNQYARIAAAALNDPAEAHFRWFRDVVASLEESRRANGYVWRKYVRYLQGQGNPLHYEDIRSALSIYRRHKLTQYDDYERWGCDKGTARRLSNEELKWKGLPESRTGNRKLEAGRSP